MVGALRVHPHKHYANDPPQKVRGAADCRRVVSFSKRRTRAAERAFTREHPMAPLTVVPRGSRLLLARQGLVRFPHSRSSTQQSNRHVISLTFTIWVTCQYSLTSSYMISIYLLSNRNGGRRDRRSVVRSHDATEHRHVGHTHLARAHESAPHSDASRDAQHRRARHV